MVSGPHISYNHGSIFRTFGMSRCGESIIQVNCLITRDFAVGPTHNFSNPYSNQPHDFSLIPLPEIEIVDRARSSRPTYEVN